MRRVTVLAVLLVFTLGAAAPLGCGSTVTTQTTLIAPTTTSSSAETTSTDGSTTTDKALGDLLPADVKSKGTISVAADPAISPWGFLDDNMAWQGVNVDILNELGKRLGVSFQFSNLPFDNIIPSLKAGRYDMAMTAMLDNKKRQEQVDFVDYARGGSTFLTKAGDTKRYKSLDELAGLSVGVLRGSFEEFTIQEMATKLTNEGKPAPKVSVFNDANSLVLAASSGRVDVSLGDIGMFSYIVKQRPQDVQLGGDPYDFSGIIAITLSKGSPLTTAIQTGMQQMADDGTLTKIAEKWGLVGQMLDTISVNSGK